MNKTKILFAMMVGGIALLTTSCIEYVESDPEVSCYATIVGTYPNYELYVDGGGIITPTKESVNSLTSSKGFGDYKRAALGVRYKSENVVTDEMTGATRINNAELLEGQIIPVGEILTKAEAEEKLVSSEDSTFAITEFKQVWAYNGYMTVLTTGYYSADEAGNGVYPTTTLVYDPESLSVDEITLKLYYNRHSAQSAAVAGGTTFATSYSIEDFVRIVPGSEDQVKVTVKPDRGADPVTFTVSRKQFTFTK